MERTLKLNPDSTLVIKHSLNVKNVTVTARTTDGKRFQVKYKVKDNNNVEILNKGDQNIKFTIVEVLANAKKTFWSEFAQYSTRFLMSVRSFNVKFRNTRQLSLPQFIPDIGDIFGQTTHYDVMAPGLDFAFGFTDESYIEKAKERGWLLCDQNMTSPAIYSKTQEFSAEIQIEPVKGLKITLTGNRTDNRTNQLQFMYDDMTTLYSGSYTKTHVAIATALRGFSADNGYRSDAFDKFLQNIPVIAQRLEDKYNGLNYPEAGFIKGTVYAGRPFDPKNGTVSTTSSDVLIPAFIAAYSGKDAKSVNLNPFPGLSSILPNWRMTYDGLSKLPFFMKYFKSFTLSHAYQCTYSVGSFSSYSADNNITFNAEYRDARTLSLNSSAGQLVETSTKSFVIGAGYKIANFNTVLKMKNRQKGVSNDLTLNLDFQINNNTALIRKILDGTAQPTSGTRTLGINFTANYVMSKRVTVGAYFLLILMAV